jgi:hypothetical protein
MTEGRTCEWCKETFFPSTYNERGKPRVEKDEVFQKRRFCGNSCAGSWAGAVKTKKSVERYDEIYESGRTCTICGALKSSDDFTLVKYDKGERGLSCWCKECQGEYQRKLKLKQCFSLTPEEYDAILSKQNGVCFLCGNPPGKKRLAVDHDHLTGKIRGLLCGACNQALGVFGDDVTRLQKAINYLLRPIASEALGGDRFGMKGKTKFRYKNGPKTREEEEKHENEK